MGYSLQSLGGTGACYRYIWLMQLVNIPLISLQSPTNSSNSLSSIKSANSYSCGAFINLFRPLRSSIASSFDVEIEKKLEYLLLGSNSFISTFQFFILSSKMADKSIITSIAISKCGS